MSNPTYWPFSLGGWMVFAVWRLVMHEGVRSSPKCCCVFGNEEGLLCSCFAIRSNAFPIEVARQSEIMEKIENTVYTGNMVFREIEESAVNLVLCR